MPNKVQGIAKRKLNLPMEFNLATYNLCETWTIQDWADALYARLPYSGIFLGDESVPSHKKDDLVRVAHSFMRHPSRVDDAFIYMRPLRDQYAMEYFDSSDRIVNDPAYQDFYGKLCAVENDQLHDWNPEGIEDSSPLENLLYCRVYPTWKMHQRLSQRSSLGKTIFSLRADLSAPDSVLIREFTQWLKDARPRTAVQKDFKEKLNLKTWYEKRYLPLLDLKFWSAVSGAGLTDEDIAVLIFADEIDKDLRGFSMENFRKTHFPNAMRLLTTTFVQDLQYYACQDSDPTA